MKTFTAMLIAAVAADEAAFMQWVNQWGKSYGTREEFEFRMARWLETEANIIANNMSESTHTLAHNKMSDWTDAEYQRLLSYKPMNEFSLADEVDEILPPENIASSINWVNKGAVTPVKDQGSCGSCWAFSSTGGMEGACQIKHGDLLSFSEQQLVDCTRSYHNQGCNGGWQDNAYKYLKKTALSYESDYRYTGKDGSCKGHQGDSTAKATSYTSVGRSGKALRSALNKQPVSVTIEADKSIFQSYKSGVITSGCGTSLDHAVLAVGYGTLNGTPYILVKNSWNTWWGDNGYVRIGDDNSRNGVCGIYEHALYPSCS